MGLDVSRTFFASSTTLFRFNFSLGYKLEIKQTKMRGKKNPNVKYGKKKKSEWKHSAVFAHFSAPISSSGCKPLDDHGTLIGCVCVFLNIVKWKQNMFMDFEFWWRVCVRACVRLRS